MRNYLVKVWLNFFKCTANPRYGSGPDFPTLTGCLGICPERDTRRSPTPDSWLSALSMSGTCPRARCDNDKGLLHQSLTVGLPHFSFVPPISSIQDSRFPISDSPILILSTTSRSAMPGCDKIFWFSYSFADPIADRHGKRRYLLWNWFFITLSHLQKTIAHSSRYLALTLLVVCVLRKPHSRPAATGNFTLHLAWRLIGSCSIFRPTRLVFHSLRDQVFRGLKRNDLGPAITIWATLSRSGNCNWSIVAFDLIDFCFDSLMNLVIHIDKCHDLSKESMEIACSWQLEEHDRRSQLTGGVSHNKV